MNNSLKKPTSPATQKFPQTRKEQSNMQNISSQEQGCNVQSEMCNKSVIYQSWAKNGYGVYVNLNRENPYICTAHGNIPIKCATLVFQENGNEKVFHYDSGRCVDNFQTHQIDSTVYLGQKDLILDSGEKIEDDRLEFYFLHGVNADLFSAADSEKSYGFSVIYVESETCSIATTFGIAATIGYDAGGNVVVFNDMTSDSNRMGLYCQYSQATAQLAAKYNAAKMNYWENDCVLEGGNSNELDG